MNASQRVISTATLPGQGASGYSRNMASQPLAHDPPGPRLRLVVEAGSIPAPNVHPVRAPQDEELVEAFQAGRAGAGAQLYDRLFPVVDATLVRILGRREHDHADLVQSAFEQIVSTLSKRKFARHCGLPGWAAVITCHVGLNAVRSRRRERAVIDRGQELGAQGTFEHAAPAALESQIGARDELSWVRRHLAEMDPDRVTALLLNAMGHELTEIAGLTGTSVAAAQSRLSRGRRDLRERLEEANSRRPTHGDRRQT
jgi:RNA polymerase sigma-70 factor, ECF subfamily